MVAERHFTALNSGGKFGRSERATRPKAGPDGMHLAAFNGSASIFHT
jgi:hypothetical protein